MNKLLTAKERNFKWASYAAVLQDLSRATGNRLEGLWPSILSMETIQAAQWEVGISHSVRPTCMSYNGGYFAHALPFFVHSRLLRVERVELPEWQGDLSLGKRTRIRAHITDLWSLHNPHIITYINVRTWSRPLFFLNVLFTKKQANNNWVWISVMNSSLLQGNKASLWCEG
jgi:hypothetical protein